MIFRLELLRLRRSGRVLLTLLALVLFLGVAVIDASSGTEQAGHWSPGHALDYFLNTASLLLPLFVAAEGAALIAGETSSGTLLLLLTRPVPPYRVFLAKVAVGLLWIGVVLGAALAACLAIGWWGSGWVGLDANFTTSREMGPFRAFEHGLTMGRMLVRASWLWPALLGMSLVPLSLSFLISTWVKRPLFAGMLSVAGYWVLAMVLGAGTGAIGVDPMILLRPLFLEPIDTRALLVGAGLVGGVSLLLFFLALRRFRLREAR